MTAFRWYTLYLETKHRLSVKCHSVSLIPKVPFRTAEFNKLSIPLSEMDMTIREMFVIFIQARIVGKYYVIFLFEKGLIKTINSNNYKQELSEDNEVRREATKYEWQHLVYVIQSSWSRSLGQKLWYDVKSGHKEYTCEL